MTATDLTLFGFAAFALGWVLRGWVEYSRRESATAWRGACKAWEEAAGRFEKLALGWQAEALDAGRQRDEFARLLREARQS